MVRPASDFRLAVIALFAIAGMLSFAGDGRADSAGSAISRSGRSCCASRVCPAGCCVRGGEARRSGLNAPPVAGVSRKTLASTDRSCDCGPSEPATPAAARQESRSLKNWPGTDFGIPASLLITTNHLGLLRRVVEPAPRPPKTPLYLTTVRLLI